MIGLGAEQNKRKAAFLFNNCSEKKLNDRSKIADWPPLRKHAQIPLQFDQIWILQVFVACTNRLWWKVISVGHSE